ncbi:MAG: UrcA family protein [Hyphomonadaceae bacterium]
MSPTLKSAFAALILGLAFPPAALAQTSADHVTTHIAFDDLDMSAPADAGILLKRIKSAANTVCEQAVPRSALTPRALTLCRKDTVGHVVRELSISTLTAAWSGDHGMQLASR